ncbi:MAG: T9SS type A sorting domain-containing protein, partial [Bacteroidales bacterium]
GLFISVWTDQRDSTYKIYGRIFNCDREYIGPSILFSDGSITEDIYYPRAFWDSDSTLTLFYWADLYAANIYYQRFKISGVPLTSPVPINEIEGDVADYSVSKDDDGRFIVIWSNDDYTQIYAQRINYDFSFIGNNFRISDKSYYFIYRLATDIKDGKVCTIFNNWPYEIYLNIFDYDNPPVGIDENDEELILKDFVLYQNYPNPFNSSTSFRFKINETSNVKIVIFDILGNQVRLITDKQHTPGYYTIQWDGKNNEGISTTSGIYLVKAFLPNKNYTKKMVLIK